MKYLALLTITFLFLASCNEDDTSVVCGGAVVFPSDLDAIKSDEFSITTAQIVDQCLEVTIGAGGCDGESWTAGMYGAAVIIQVFPPTIPLKLSLNDEEDCEAFIQRTFSFDLSQVIATYPTFFLTIEGYEEMLQYEAED